MRLAPLLLLLPATLGGQSVVWSASGGTVTAVNDSQVRYKAPASPGAYTVTATADGKSGRATVTVCAAVTHLAVSPHALNVYPDTGTGTLASILINPCGVEQATADSTAWISRDTTIVTITSHDARNAVLAGHDSGATYVVGTLIGHADSSLITVTTAPPLVGDTLIAIDSTACNGADVDVPAGDDIQAAVTAHGTSTSFCLGAGIHRQQQVDPKTGDVFLGETGAIMTGAKVLTGFVSDGAGHQYVTGQTQQNTDFSAISCDGAWPGCNLPEQLFVGSTLYEHMTTLAAVGPGKWYFDYAANRIYVDDPLPSGVIETSVTPYAFGGSATDVTIRGLIIQRYATGNQHGTVGYTGGSGWHVEHTIVQDSHGTGIKLSGTNPLIRANIIRRQGQLGWAVNGGTGGRADSNHINGNANVGFGGGSAAQVGASKITRTVNFTFQHNVSDANNGAGFWADIENTGTVVCDNTITNNSYRGIDFEISSNAEVCRNTITGNGFASVSTPTTGAGVWVSNSNNIEVHHNTLSGNRAGITGFVKDRPGEPVTEDMDVHDNTITQSSGILGGVQDLSPANDPYTVGANNSWGPGNVYHCSTCKFRWSPNVDVTWAAWQSAGQDAGGTFGP